MLLLVLLYLLQHLTHPQVLHHVLQVGRKVALVDPPVTELNPGVLGRRRRGTGTPDPTPPAQDVGEGTARGPRGRVVERRVDLLPLGPHRLQQLQLPWQHPQPQWARRVQHHDQGQLRPQRTSRVGEPDADAHPEGRVPRPVRVERRRPLHAREDVRQQSRTPRLLAQEEREEADHHAGVLPVQQQGPLPVSVPVFHVSPSPCQSQPPC